MPPKGLSRDVRGPTGSLGRAVGRPLCVISVPSWSLGMLWILGYIWGLPMPPKGFGRDLQGLQRTPKVLRGSAKESQRTSKGNKMAPKAIENKPQENPSYIDSWIHRQRDG